MYSNFSDRKRSIIYLPETESTNNDLKSLIRSEDTPVFSVISAKKQISGRGRLGRTFISPEGGLYFSMSYPLNGNEKNIPYLTLLAGLSVSCALEEVSGIKTEIKWPNDIYLGGKKLGGILTELVSGKNLCAAVGIGINMSAKKEDFPEELSGIVTSLFMEGIVPPHGNLVIEKTAEILDGFVYGACELYEACPSTVEAIKSRSFSLGKKVKYTLGDTVFEGKVSDILNTGAAVITLSDGSVKEIFCGEITQ